MCGANERLPAWNEIDCDGYVKSEYVTGICEVGGLCQEKHDLEKWYCFPLSCHHSQPAMGSGTWKKRRKKSKLKSECTYPLISNQEKVRNTSNNNEYFYNPENLMVNLKKIGEWRTVQ